MAPAKAGMSNEKISCPLLKLAWSKALISSLGISGRTLVFPERNPDCFFRNVVIARIQEPVNTVFGKGGGIRLL